MARATVTEQQTLLLSRIEAVVERKENEVFATWHDAKGKVSGTVTYRRLWEEAGDLSKRLLEQWGAKPGDRVILCYQPGLHFFSVFYACLRAGVTAVMVYPPSPPLAKSLPKVNKVIADCAPVLILMDGRIANYKAVDQLNPMSKSAALWPKGVPIIATDKSWAPLRSNSSIKRKSSRSNSSGGTSNEIAFLQYTSGSTGDPKGVMVTYEALLEVCGKIGGPQLEQLRADNVLPLRPQNLKGFSWLPQYHDMGLIYCMVAPFAMGCSMHYMSPTSFIGNPLLWLELVSSHKVDWTTSPDFAYRLCHKRFTSLKKPLESPLDLSRCMFLNCAEPVRPDTIELFEEAFKPSGLGTNPNVEWFGAGYGLAEHVVAATYAQGPAIRSRSRPDLVASGKIAKLEPTQSLKIVNAETCLEVDEGFPGEIWLSGPSVAAGYYGKPELSDEVFHARLAPGSKPGGATRKYLRTGDTGFIEDGLLFICGRIKDLIILNGRNIFPQDVEFAAQDASAAVRPGCVAAFGADESGMDGELQIVFEIRRSSESPQDAAAICEAIRVSVQQAVGLGASRVVATRERTIPKTTSGKIRRRATRDAFKAGELNVIYEAEYYTEEAATVDEVSATDAPWSNQGVEFYKLNFPASNIESRISTLRATMEPSRAPASMLQDELATALKFAIKATETGIRQEKSMKPYASASGLMILDEDLQSIPLNDFLLGGASWTARARFSCLRPDATQSSIFALAVRLEDPNDARTIMDLTLHTGTVAVFHSLQSFQQFAKVNSADDTTFKAWLERNPQAYEAVCEAFRRSPESVAGMSYYSWTPMELQAKDGSGHLIKFRLVPTSGLEHGRLSSEEQKSLWRRGRLAGEQRAPDYIIKELEARLALGPQEFTFEVQTYPITEETLNSARAWDSKWNPSVAWPEDCSPWLPLGTLTLDAFVEPCEGNKIDFSIANHASCLSWTPAESVTDPQSIAAARLAVYEAGAKERHAKQEAIREKRVCIVGGGPCGLSTARELVAMGFSVTILEKEETIGGMCRNKSYDGHVFSLGGHMVFPSVYPRIRKLAKEYGLKLIRDFEGANLDLECGKLLDPEPPTSTVLEKARIFAEMAKKVEQMDELEGISSTNYEPGELADRVQRPLAEFMASHDLMPLWDRVAHTFSAAGYGTEEDRVPAEYYARFYNHTGADTMRYMFENGFQALWEGVAANLPDVRTCHTVTNIRRSHPSGSGPAAVQISWRTGTGKDESASFDAVVMAQSPSIACKMMPDLSPQELSTIAKVKTLPYFTLVVRASNYPTAMVGKWLFVTSGRHTTDPEAQTVLFLQPYEDSDATLVVGYCEHETDMGEVRRRVVVQAEKDLGRLGAKLGDILDFHPWPAYFPHFSPEDLAADAVKDAEALQGKGGAYYATTLFTFELTEFAVATGAKLAARIRDDFEQQGRHLGTTVTDAIVTSRNTAASDPRTDAAVANPQGHISRIAAPRQHYPRVCIVGGGPSGLSTAKKLTSLGFRVTLLEREESVGGMSRDAIFDGHRHSLGAHMIFPSVYPRIRKLAREYGLKLIPDFEGEDLDLAAGRLVKQVKHEESHETQDFLDAMKKFADIATHVDEAGIAKTGHKENKYTKELQRPLVEFMACPELSTLWARTAFQFSAVGYGTEEDRIPTEYYARYYNHTGGDTMRYMFQDGFQSLWHSIANSLHDIRVSHTVMDVRRHCPTEKGPSAVRVLWKNAQGQEQSDLFDAVVMAQSPGLAPRVMSDLTDQERKVMGKVKTLPYFTLYVRAPGLPSHMVGKHLFVTSSRHKLDLEVQTVLIFQPYEGSDATAVLGYCDHRDDMESVKREILRQARKDLANLGATMGEVLAYYPWPAYFPHFSPEDLAAGVAKDMDALQGNGGVYYATTLFTFELTEYAAAAGEALGERMSEDFASRFPELIPELNIPIYDVTTEALHQPAAQEPLDTKIAAVVGQVLKRGDILPDSDLFDMGLTSMDAGAIARALKDEVPECRELDMITVFENPSPAQLASFLGHAGHSDRPEPGNLSAVSSSPTIRRLDLDIARVVARVLKRDDILPDSDLFDMGLTSMDAGAIARALKEAVPECSDLDMITVFENPSPAQLASHLGHPAPSITKARNLTTREPPKGRLDLEIASVVGRILKRDDVLPESDLFDMGLTSVDAGAIAQALKDEVPLCKDLTMIAVFENSSPAMLAAFLQGTQLSPRNSSCNTPTTKSESPSPTFDEPREAKTLHSKEWISVTPGERAFLQKTATLASADKTLNCGSSLLIRALQVVLMPVVMLLSVGIPIYPSFVYLTHTLLKSGSIHEAILVTPVLAVSFAVVQLLLALMVKWVVIGRYRCGSHKIWGWYHLRWWFVDSIMAFPNCVIMPCVRGTFVARWWFTLLGAKIHPTAMFDTCRITECDLVSLGPGSVIQYDASLSGAVICADGLLLANVTVESGATVGLRAQLEPTLGDRAGFSFAMAVSVPDGALVPPMRGAESVRYPSEADLGVYQHQPSLLGQIAGIALTIAVHWASFVPYIYALVYLVVEKRASDYTVAAVAALYPLLPAHAYILVLILCQHIRKLLGVKSTNRWWRWWLSCAQSTFFFTLMTRMLAATPVCTWMMRAMGMRIKGNSVMFGVPWTVDYDHITIGPDFVSGGRNYICTVDRSGILRPVTLGRNVTLGNEVNIEPGAILGDNCTLGDATTIGAKCQIPTSATAIGSGPIVLRSGIPRQAIQLNVNWCTGTMLQLSATLPVYASVVVGSLLCAYCAEYAMKHGWSPYEAAVFFPSLTRLAEQDFTNAARGEPELARWTAGLSGTFLLFMVGFMATVLSVLFKRLFQYHFEPFSRHEYYSVHHCMWEANLVMMNVTYDAFMWLFRGWGGFCSWMRILGARIGDRVCTFAFTTEADLLRIGNDVVIGRDCVLDAHTIAEQRMAMDPICIGNGVNLGNRTHVIAGGVINSNAAIRSFSLVLSGEAIGEGTWSGQPIRRTKANLYNVA